MTNSEETASQETKPEVQSSQVTFDPKMIDGQRSHWKPREAVVEVPELNRFMKVEEGQTVVIKVQQLTLPQYLSTRQEIQDYSRNLFDGILSAADEVEEVSEEMKHVLGKLPADTKYKLEVVKHGLVDPKIRYPDLLFLSKMFPLVIMRLYSKIIELTSQGADLKKNSSE